MLSTFTADLPEDKQALLFRLLFQRSSDAILIASNDRCIDANFEAAKCLGFNTKSELVGKKVSELFFELSPSEDDSSVIIAETVVSFGSETWTRRKGLRPNGEKFYVRMHSEFVETPQPIEIIFFRDITEKIEVQRNVENYRAYLAVLAEIRRDFFERKEKETVDVFCEAASDCFGLISVGLEKDETEIDEEDVFSSRISRQSAVMFGVDTVQFSSPSPQQPSSELSSEHSPQFSHGEFDIANFSIPFEVEGKSMGRIVFLSQDFSLLEESTNIYLRNLVTELSRILEEKRHWIAQQQALKKAKEAAEEGSRIKARFLADMSHEIRTPLTSILGYAEVLEEMIEDQRRILKSCLLDSQIMDAAFETIRTVGTNGDHLVQIINNILDFSKIETDKLVVQSENVDFVRLLAEVYSFFRAKTNAKRIDYRIKNRTAFPDRICTDALRLRQVLINLIGNAVKFTDVGGVEVHLYWIPDTVNSKSGELRIIIHDSGIGISEEEQKNLFNDFAQARGDTAKRFGGTGLGLALSSRLLKLLDGRIILESQPNEGSIFSVLLRQRLPDDAVLLDHFDPEKAVHRMANESKNKQWEPGLLRNYRLLLAEDSKDCRRLFQMILTKAGAEVDIADNGQTALRLVRQSLTTQRPYNLVLMDMQMPILDGIQATKQLRSEGYDRPIVALTAHALEEEQKKCLQVGCDDFISKPILKDDLLTAILKNVNRPS